jgi:hypothetical protein
VTHVRARNGRFDILAANDLGRALSGRVHEESRTPSTARFAFLNPHSTVLLDFDKAKDDAVAYLRAEDRHPGRPVFTRPAQDS